MQLRNCSGPGADYRERRVPPNSAERKRERSPAFFLRVKDYSILALAIQRCKHPKPRATDHVAARKRTRSMESGGRDKMRQRSPCRMRVSAREARDRTPTQPGR